MGAAHPHAARMPVRTTLLVLIPVAAVLAGLVIWLWPPSPDVAAPGDGGKRVTGHVTAIVPEDCSQSTDAPPGYRPPADAICGVAQVRIGAQVVPIRLPEGPGAPQIHAGDDVVLTYSPEVPGPAAYQIIDHQRGKPLWILAAALALTIVAFGRLRGLAALAGLAVTFGVLLWFIVPAILAGRPPLLTAIVGSAVIMFVVLYLTHGLRRSTSVAVAGTLTSLTLTAVLATVAVSAAHLSGYGGEDALYVGLTANVDMQGLLLAGIVIGALGVLDDVTVTQAVTVDELAAANPGYRFRDLYRAATRVGRAHIASVVNTIILAYAGASLPLLLLIATSDQPTGQILTNQMLAEELVRSMVGTIGLIAAVPITTALAAAVVVRSRHPVARPATEVGVHVDAAWDPVGEPDTPAGVAPKSWSTFG